MEVELPKRKHTRLRQYDYGQNGAYFVTICTAHRKPLLCKIAVGQGLAPAEIRLTAYGLIARKQLLALHDRFPFVFIDNFVIMPDHIHVLFSVHNENAPVTHTTIVDVVRVFKSLTTRECKSYRPIDRLFQSSFNDHIVRNQQDYDAVWEYINTNPIRWATGHQPLL